MKEAANYIKYPIIPIITLQKNNSHYTSANAAIIKCVDGLIIRVRSLSMKESLNINNSYNILVEHILTPFISCVDTSLSVPTILLHSVLFIIDKYILRLAYTMVRE